MSSRRRLAYRLSILDTPNQHMGIDRYRARAHEPPTPRHDMS